MHRRPASDVTSAKRVRSVIYISARSKAFGPMFVTSVFKKPVTCHSELRSSMIDNRAAQLSVTLAMSSHAYIVETSSRW